MIFISPFTPQSALLAVTQKATIFYYCMVLCFLASFMLITLGIVLT